MIRSKNSSGSKTVAKKLVTRKLATKNPAAKKAAPAKKKASIKRAARAKKPTAKKAAPAKKKPAAKKAAAKKSAAKRKPNAAFMKAMTPSGALAAVVGNTPMPRGEVTKKIRDYIKKNKLQDAINRRLINADELKAVSGGKGKACGLIGDRKTAGLVLFANKTHGQIGRLIGDVSAEAHG